MTLNPLRAPSQPLRHGGKLLLKDSALRGRIALPGERDKISRDKNPEKNGLI